jgi:gliding motility-associated-like protein
MMSLKKVKNVVCGFVFALALFASQSAKADHLAAIDIYYDYVAPLTYDVHLVLFRACSGIPLSNPQSGCAYSTSTGQTVTFSFDTTGVGEVQDALASNYCPNIQTNCTGASQYEAYTRWHYKALVVLPNVATDWVFQWSSCCRNQCIVNLQGPTGLGMSVEATLNNVIRPINSSPRLTERPIPAICLNAASQYLNAPVDPDNDSLRFESIEPLNFGGSCTSNPAVPYVSGYSAQYPINTSTGTFNYNPLSGAVCFTATQQGCFVLAFRCWDIDKYTGDTLGSVMRDVQLGVFPCFGNFNLACDSFGNVVGDSARFVTVCPGNPIVINDTISSTSLANLIVVSCNNNLIAPTSTFVPNAPFGIGSHGGTFTWVPTQADAGTHQLTFKYKDSTCTNNSPLMFPAYHTYQITVLDGVSIPPSYSFCLNGDSLNLSAIGPPSMNQWNWTVLPGQTLPAGATPNFSNPNTKQTMAYPTHTMYIQVEGGPPIGNCPNKDTAILNVFPEIFFTQVGAPYNLCANEAVQLNITTTNPGGQFLWQPNIFLNNNAIVNPICTPIVATTYSVQYTSPNLCKVTRPVPVTIKGIKPLISASASKNPVCANESFDLLASAAAQPCGQSYLPSLPGTTQYLNVGTENIINTTFSPFIRDWNAGYRAQYLYSASELRAAGLKPGNISALALRVLQDGAGPTEDTLRSFRIKMGCTQLQNLSATVGYIAGLSTVFSANKYAPFVGLNTFNFTNGYKHFWDGASNLVVEVCYNLPGNVGSSTAEVSCSNTDFQSAMVSQDWAGGGCNIQSLVWNTSVGSIRPNTIFHYEDVVQLNYSWLPATNLNNASIQNPTVLTGIPNQTNFNVASYEGSPSCANTANVNVNVDFSGSVDATASTLNMCYPGFDTLKAIPSATSPSYKCGDNDFTPKGNPIVYTVGAPVTPANPNSISSNGPFPFTAARMQFIVTAGELQAGGFAANVPHTLDAISFEVVNKFTTDPYLGYTIKLACISNTINELSSFKEMPMSTVYYAPSYNTIPGWNIFNLTPKYLWNGKDNILVDICFDQNVNFTSDDVRMTTGVYPYPVMVSANNWNGSGCNLTTGGFASPDRPQTRFIATEVNQKPFEYGWQPSLFTYDSSAQNTLTYFTGTTTYTVFLITNNGCKRYDSVTVRLIEHDVVVSPEDTAVCVGDQFYARAIGSGTGINPKYAWSPTVGIESPNSALTFVDAPNPPPIYFVVRTDEFGCKDTAELKVQFRLPPPITINGGLDTLIVPYDLEANLVATGGTQTYSWSPSWAVSNPNIANPLIQPKQSGLYFVYGVDSMSCEGYDSIYVKVDDANPVVMPNAFTPNGDGDNDLFKPWSQRANLFEEVQEFQVMNRWGQQVYNGDSQSPGWDGTFKGSNCEMDTYYYTIILAYPNGSVKKLKGEVVLIR